MQVEREQESQFPRGADRHDQGEPAQQEWRAPPAENRREATQPGKVGLMEIIGMFGGCSSGL
jgi:hypothetical protein